MKNPLKRAWRSFSTWRHGRGFGVHSPLAYDLLLNTLREPKKTGYYAYPELRSLESDKKRRRIARIVFRLVSRFSPKQIAVAGKEADVDYWTAIIRLASRRSVCGPLETVSEPDMVIVADSTHLVSRAIRERIDVYLGYVPDFSSDGPLPSAFHKRLGPLVMDSGRGYAVAVHRHGLSPIRLKARF